jgi:hypothetical protein
MALARCPALAPVDRPGTLAREGAASGTCANRGEATSRATRDRPSKRRIFSEPMAAVPGG